ncbi:MAG: hypothetical protein AAGD01_00205 [Acidobacteriota bacterium]
MQRHLFPLNPAPPRRWRRRSARLRARGARFPSITRSVAQSLLWAGLASLASLTLVSCGANQPSEQESAPVGRLQVEIGGEDLPYPQWRTLHLRWQATTALPTAPSNEKPRSSKASSQAPEAEPQPRIFVHLVDPEGELSRTFDQDLDEPWRPGASGRLEVPIHHSALAPPLAPGDYQLTVGLYRIGGDGLPDRRFPLEVDLESSSRSAARTGADRPDPDSPSPRAEDATTALVEIGTFEYSVARLAVEPVSAEAPSFSFGQGWEPTPPREELQERQPADRQSPGARRILEDAKLDVLNLEVPGSLLLRIEIPPLAEDLPKPDRPWLELTGDCSQAQRAIRQPGVHRLLLPIYPTGGEPRCRLDFFPHPIVAEHAPPQLQTLGWAPAQL